jgi:hypothetical protein
VRVTFTASLHARLASDAAHRVYEEFHVRGDWHKTK